MYYVHDCTSQTCMCLPSDVNQVTSVLSRSRMRRAVECDLGDSKADSGSYQSLVDAKRRFFSQPATPLRLDARRLFADERATRSSSPIAAAVPKSNHVVGSRGA